METFPSAPVRDVADDARDEVPPASPCPACGGHMRGVFEVGRLPVNVGVFYDGAAEAEAAPMGDIELAHCERCGLVHNRRFDPDADIFRPGYEVALHHSQTFRTFIADLVDRLSARFDLTGKRILEIGCGDGYVLKQLAERGNDCIGIDPTVREPGPVPVSQGTMRLVRDYFGPAHAAIEADFLCCLSVFEDIARPGPFLGAAHAIARRSGAPLYIEVFNGARAIEAGEVWSVHYEQCNYFGLEALVRILELNGFAVEDAGTCYEGDQYLYAVARAVPPTVDGSPDRGEGDAPNPTALERFATSFKKRRDDWNERLAHWRKGGESAVAWGTGGKGITFLNTVDSRGIEAVLEINPDKQGRHLPGTGHPIVAPERLAELRPDHVIVSNALYLAEMEAQARALGVECRFWVA